MAGAGGLAQLNGDVVGPAPDQMKGDEQDDCQADPGQPAVAFEQVGYEPGGDPHQDDRDDKAGDEHPGVLVGRAGDGQDVVEAHADIGERDLEQGLAERLGRGAREMRGAGIAAEFAVHLPADPEQQQAPRKHEADDRDQPHGDEGERDPQNRREEDADEDGPVFLAIRQPGHRQPHHHGVVASEHEVDEQDLGEGREFGPEALHGNPLAWTDGRLYVPER